MPCIQGIRILAWYTYGNYNTRIILHRCYSAIKKRIIRYSSHWFAEAEQASENAFYSRKRHRTRARAFAAPSGICLSNSERDALSCRSQAAVQKRLSAVASLAVALRFGNRILLCCDLRTPWEKASLLLLFLPPLKGLTVGNCSPARRRRSVETETSWRNEERTRRLKEQREQRRYGPPSPRMPLPWGR